MRQQPFGGVGAEADRQAALVQPAAAAAGRAPAPALLDLRPLAGPDKEWNWLPTPKGPFFLVTRMYGPKQPLIDGSWKEPPRVELN